MAHPRNVTKSDYLAAIKQYKKRETLSINDCDFVISYHILKFLDQHKDNEVELVEAYDPWNHSLFSAVIEKADKVLFDILVKKPMLINRPSFDGLTPLMQACRIGNEYMITRLLAEPGIDVNARAGIRGLAEETALFYAAIKGHAYCVNALLHRAEISLEDKSKALSIIENTLNEINCYPMRTREDNIRAVDMLTVSLLLNGVPFNIARLQANYHWPHKIEPDSSKLFDYLQKQMNGYSNRASHELGMVSSIALDRQEENKIEAKPELVHFDLKRDNVSSNHSSGLYLSPSPISVANEEVKTEKVKMPAYGTVFSPDILKRPLAPRVNLSPIVDENSLSVSFEMTDDPFEAPCSPILAPESPERLLSSDSVILNLEEFTLCFSSDEATPAPLARSESRSSTMSTTSYASFISYGDPAPLARTESSSSTMSTTSYGSFISYGDPAPLVRTESSSSTISTTSYGSCFSSYGDSLTPLRTEASSSTASFVSAKGMTPKSASSSACTTPRHHSAFFQSYGDPSTSTNELDAATLILPPESPTAKNTSPYLTGDTLFKKPTNLADITEEDLNNSCASLNISLSSQ